MHCLIIDIHPITLLGLRLLIQGNFPDWEIFTTTSVDEAAKYIEPSNAKSVDFVLIVHDPRNETHIDLLLKLQQNAARPILSLIISSASDEVTIELCRRGGALGYVSKRSDPSEIIRAIQVVCSGKEYFSRGIEKSSRALASNFPILTSRQKDLIDLLLLGYSNKMISSALNLSYGTVKNYMFDLMRLLSVKSRFELVTKIRGQALQLNHDISPETMHCVRCKSKLVNDLSDACPNLSLVRNSENVTAYSDLT